MKENVDVMALIAGMIGAFMRGIKKHVKMRDLVINTIVGGALSFLIVVGCMQFIPKYTTSPKVMIGVSIFIGWIANTFTDKLESAMSDGYDILVGFFKRKYPSNKENKDSDEK